MREEGNEDGNSTKWIIAIVSTIVATLFGWIVWVTMMVMHLNYVTRFNTIDRLSATMFIEIQQELQTKNPQWKSLTASEVRVIQNRNPPYRIDKP